MGATVIILIACVLIELFAGYRRGVFRQALHFIAFAAAAIIAYFSVDGIIQELYLSLGLVDGATLEQMVTAMKADPDMAQFITSDVEAFLLALDPKILEYSFTLIIGTVSTFIFWLYFLICNLVAKVIWFIVKLFIPKGQGVATKMPGLVLGAAEGLIFAAILMLPFANVAGLVREAYGIVAESEGETNEETMAFYEQELASFAEDGVLVAIDNVGGRALYDKYFTVSIDGEAYNLRDEIMTTLKIFITDVPALSETDWYSLSENDKAAIGSIIDTLGESEYISRIIAGVMSATFTALEDSELPVEIEPPFDSLLKSGISIFANANHKYLGEDLTTLKEVYFIFSDDGVLNAILEGGDLTEAFVRRDANGDTTVSKIIAVINENERTKSLLTELTKISITVISSEMDLGDDVTEVYENIMEGVNNILSTTSDDPEEISALLNETLYNNGIELEEPIIDNMAEYIASEFGDMDEVSEEDFNDIILNYYDSYLEYQESLAN